MYAAICIAADGSVLISLADSTGKSVILLTHIPLARPRSASCGPLRELGNIRAGTGYGYTNTLSDGLTDMLLRDLRPSLIFRFGRLPIFCGLSADAANQR